MFEKAVGLKKKIRDGKQVLGAQVQPTATREELEKVMEIDDYDFLLIDAQHTPYEEQQIADFCQTAEAMDLFVQLRIKHTRLAFLSGNYLDLGPCGVEIPQVELDSTVEEALHGFYFPPEAGRSFGGRYRRAPGGKTPVEYAAWWNTYGVLWMQVESVQASTHCRQLAKSGVDCLSFGPIDLTFNLQSHPTHPYKTVDDCVQGVCDALSDLPTQVCFRNYDKAKRKLYADMGVTVFVEIPGYSA